MQWSRVWEWLGRRRASWEAYQDEAETVLCRARELRGRSDSGLREAAAVGDPGVEVLAPVCEAARRSLDLEPFPMQVVGGLVMASGRIAEMATGEGKTLAATLPACSAALGGTPVHVLTANDYLARRDARWMAPLYQLLGLTVGWVEQGMGLAARQAAYSCDVTYASATEVGFDFLRDQTRRRPEDLVQRSFGLALVDEADSILIDEARIPLVIADEAEAPTRFLGEADEAARSLEGPVHYETVDGGSRVVLTEAGAARVEARLNCGNLFDPGNAPLLAALSEALHAHVLLRRDVDYLVKEGAIVLIDAFKGRAADTRRWPRGLQAAIEMKERLAVRRPSRVLGSMTLQGLIGLYPRVCGMTGTATTQARELREMYGLEVVAVPTHRPVVRRDEPDVVFATETEKDEAVVAEIRRNHAAGRPVLVGTASVAASERLGRLLETEGIRCQLLNARNEGAEAAVIAQAGRLGAVTISTNMAGRGTDILLGGNPAEDREAVVARGGLYVIGTNRHESRRIDNQLRGRAGRQGDPGESRFFLSLEDELFAKYGLEAEADVDHAQRVIEGQHLGVRTTLVRYDRMLESQRRAVHAHRRRVLLDEAESLVEVECPRRYLELRAELGEEGVRRLERDVTLAAIDECWSRYLEEVSLAREDVAWVSLARVPLHEFQERLARMGAELMGRVGAAVQEAFRAADVAAEASQAGGTGATWTYQTSDEAFPDLMARQTEGIRRVVRRVTRAG